MKTFALYWLGFIAFVTAEFLYDVFDSKFEVLEVILLCVSLTCSVIVSARVFHALGCK